MRPLFLVLAFIAQTTLASFPAPSSPEQPVSLLVFTAPAGDQQTLGIASDGNIGFIVWLDHRRAASDIYGSRIDANGVSLDPLGILIATGATNGTVIWNGSEFVVVSQRGSDDTFTFVDTEGAIVDRKTMTLLYMQLAATTGSGPDARILFVGAGRATVIDSHANIVMNNVQLAMPATQSLAIAAGGANEFLVLHTNLVPPGRNLFADRIDRDGKLLGTADTGVDHNIIGSTLALAGGDDGYLLVGRGVIERDIIAAHLDRNGTVTSQRSLATYPPALRVSVNPPAKPAVLRDGDHYQVVWTTSEANGDAHTWRAVEPATGGAPTEPAPIVDWTGSGYGATIGKVASQPVLVTDVFRAGVSTSIDPVVSVNDSHTDLSSSASLQTAPQVASSANGYAVLWNDFGPDGSSHLYLRLSSSSTPIDVASNPAGHVIKAKIAATGDTYVIAFATSSSLNGDNYVLRRFSATNGWLDAEPVPLANAKDLVLGANSDGALAVYTVACYLERCLRARAISKEPGTPLLSSETVPANIRAYQLSIASNGHDYLIAFNEDGCVPPWCNAYLRSTVVALRLGEDGRTLDSRQLLLDDTNSPTGATSIAWSGSSYAVSWARNSSIVASRVTLAGLADAAREILPRPSILLSQKLVASGAGLLLLTTQQTIDGVTSTSGVAIDSQSLLPTGEAALLVTDQPSNGSVSAAGLPTGVAIAYDRVEQAAANVARVFTRTFGTLGRRRAAR
jgi:hypothetical protein